MSIDKVFNIFEVAGVWQSEEIHTSIIAEFINPHSEYHDNGQDFLDIFLETIGLPKTNFKDAEVKTEVQTSAGRRIDMVISSSSSDHKYYVPFEVKIWAGDQPRQLVDYYEFAKNQPGVVVPHIFYLTPSGRLPSPGSKGDLQDHAICCISFKNHILSWLNKCIALGPPQDVLQIMKQMRDNIEKNIIGKDADHLLQILLDKLSEHNIVWTECTPTYLTLRLEKRGMLEFALRIQRDSKNKSKVKLMIICGIEQADGKPDYSNANKYINNHRDEYEALLADTFITGRIILENKWERYEGTVEWLSGMTVDQFAEKCYSGVCQIFNCLQEHIRLNLGNAN